ncbi:unnamed protein product [Clonostachys rosea]|uniref:Zn(2)-C6 fungal-type domain-containing protein n=1 Tax=Bionectria ochroleuca TaxID=29856 RepID=A0ABY6ULI5_BIOOC|nr:unnamed protein product [Clonostachys rosea]
MASSGEFGVFSLLSGHDPAGPGVDNRGRAIRQRRFHAKSRQGCITCKARKVKCDERRPTCLKCSKRGLTCEFGSSAVEREASASLDHHGQEPLGYESDLCSNDEPQTQPLSSVISRRSLSRTQELGTPGFDFESLQLMYHFEHFTSETLLFDKTFWEKHILPLALQHEYLMHGIMTISASHLLYVQPRVRDHNKAIALHLDSALSGFRASLSSLYLPQAQYDVVIACGFILLYYAWSVPFFNGSDEDSTSIESDGLLWFAAGIKTVIVTIYQMKPQDSMFQTYFEAQPVKSFYKWSEQTRFSYDFGQKFLDQPQAPVKHPSLACIAGCGSVNAAERLGPVFHALDATRQGEDLSEIMPAVMTYMLMWPSKAMQDFQEEIKRGDQRALVTMLSFYASSWTLLSQRAWWAYHRSKVMCTEILKRLDTRGPSCWDENIQNITEYFNFSGNMDGGWGIGDSIKTIEQV